MSILIKGIKKPEYGYIEIRLYDNRAECEFQEHVYTDLEIEEVPEPHGRLIDAEKLPIRDISRDYYEVVGVTEEDIDSAPTVIEAEE